MSVIYKYPLKEQGIQYIEMPQGAVIVHVGNQFGKICLWAIVDPTAPAAKHGICIVGTGTVFQNQNSEMQHLGTVHLQDGVVMFHVFELKIQN